MHKGKEEIKTEFHLFFFLRLFSIPLFLVIREGKIIALSTFPRVCGTFCSNRWNLLLNLNMRQQVHRGEKTASGTRWSESGKSRGRSKKESRLSDPVASLFMSSCLPISVCSNWGRFFCLSHVLRSNENCCRWSLSWVEFFDFCFVPFCLKTKVPRTPCQSYLSNLKNFGRKLNIQTMQGKLFLPFNDFWREFHELDTYFLSCRRHLS